MPVKPPFVEVYKGEKIEYFSCLNLLIPDNVIDFVNKLDMLKDFPNIPLPEFDKISIRFKLARECFNNHLAEFKNAIYKKDIKK